MIKKTILSIVASLAIANSAYAVESKVYAVVNGDKITTQTIAIALNNPKTNFDALPKEQQKNILERIVEQRILAQNAMTTDVVNEKIYKETLRGLQQDLALQVWMQKESKNIKVNDKEIKSFYDKNKELMKVPEQFKARHILVDTEKEAKDLIKTLNKSSNLKSTFIKLAKEKSTGPSGKNGGDLGWFTSETMVPEFSKAAKSLKVNKITKTPVKTKFGFHVIYLEDKKEKSNATFDNAQFQIKQQISKEKFIQHIQDLVNNLKKKSKVEYK